MTCFSTHMRDIFSRHNMALDSDQYTPLALAPELADMIGNWLELMEIEDARKERKIFFCMYIDIIKKKTIFTFLRRFCE